MATETSVSGCTGATSSRISSTRAMSDSRDSAAIRPIDTPLSVNNLSSLSFSISAGR